MTMERCDYFTFEETLNAKRYHHAVVNCGQKLMHHIMSTLLYGDINNTRDCVLASLSNTQFKKIFKKNEQQRLGTGNHKKFDISLLFKVIQSTCGLAPVGDSSWIQPTDVDESLEYLITTLKNLRNELAHSIDLPLPDDELEAYLIRLKTLAVKITSALDVRAQERGKQSEKESGKTLAVVLEILEDVKKKVNEVPFPSPSGAVAEYDTDDEDDDCSGREFDSTNVVAGAGGRTPHEQKLIDELTKQFWEFAGEE